MKRTSALLTALTLVSAVSGCSLDNLLYELDAEKELLLTAISSEREALVQGEAQLAGDPGRQEPDQPGLGGSCDATAQFAEIFARYDEDRSGDLEEPEADDVAAERDHRNDHDRMRRLEAWIALETTYDGDDSGYLEDGERDALLADFTTRCEVMQERLLADFDADGDGVLSEAEQAEARATLDADRAAHGREGEAPEVGGPGGGEGERPRPPTADQMKVRFLTLWDSNGDGETDADERAAGRAEMVAAITSGAPLGPDGHCGRDAE